MAKPKPTHPVKPKAKPASGIVKESKKVMPADTPPMAKPDSEPVRLPKAFGVMLGVFCLLVALVPVIRYYAVVWQNAVNVPFEDDYNSTLQFIANYAFNAYSLTEKLRLLFAQHNEHRIVFNRLVFLTDYAVDGHVNFRNHILFGNLSLLFILGLLFAASFRQQTGWQKMFYFLPVPFLLFQLHFWELTVWGMASIQNLYVIVFTLLSVYALNRMAERPAWFTIACVSAVVAAFTSGNGIFTFLIGLPILALMKDYLKLAIWTGITVVTVGLYFWGYARPGHHPPILDTFLANPKQFFDHFFTLTGSNFPTQLVTPILAGKWMLAVAVSVGIYIAYQKRRISLNPTVLMLIAFMYISCLSVSGGRAGFGVVQATGPRYGILSVMLLIGLYILCIETVTHRSVKPAMGAAGLALAIFLYINSYQQHLIKVEDRTTNLTYSTAFYNDNPANLILFWGDPTLGKRIFEDAVKKAVYQVPKTTFLELRSQPAPITSGLPAPTNDVVADVKPYLTHGYVVMYQAWAVNGLPSSETQIQVVAESPQNRYAFDTRRQVRYDVANHYQSPHYLQAGFSCVIKKGDLKPGHYSIGVRLVSKDKQSYLPLTSSFDV